MEQFILTLAVRWLPAVDVFSASCVSREWQHMLSAEERDNGDLWKQVCQNSGPPEIPSLTNNTDYRRLVLGLWLRDCKSTTTPAPRSYTPTLRPQDIFAVVDLYRRHQGENGKRRKEVITSLVCPIEGIRFTNNSNEMEAIFQGVNPYSASMDNIQDEEFQLWRKNISFNDSCPTEFSCPKIVGASWSSSFDTNHDKALRVDVTLFRRDSAKSVCLLHDGIMEYSECRGEEHIAYTDVYAGDLVFAASKAGCIARTLISDRSFSMVHVDSTITLAPLLPVPGSEDEPQWLENCRQALAERRKHDPNEDDMLALSKLEHFLFGLKQFTIDFLPATEEEISEFESQNDFMVALEGLCWE